MNPYEIAKQELLKNTHEIPGYQNNPEILKYTYAANGEHNDEESWCSKFINWCVRDARSLGYKCDEETKNASARSWLKWGLPSHPPHEGDIVVFWRESPDSWKGHVAFFVKDNGDGTISCLGGNQNDCVCIKNEPKDRVLDYRTT